MGKVVNAELSEDEFSEIKDFKERHGLTWEGVIKYGVIDE